MKKNPFNLLAIFLVTTFSTLSMAQRPYVISGYLPGNLSKKVYVKIDGRKIVDIQDYKITGNIIETESIIFPGMIDMHNHMEYAYAGLWDKANGQYKNRFEWRATPAYKQKTSSMDLFKGSDKSGTCAVTRWAELKALAGGVTSIQGIGNNDGCVTSFGINNIEANNEYGVSQSIKANLELLNPGNVDRIYIPLINSKMKDQGQSYDEAIKDVMDEFGINQWIADFQKPRNLANGLLLTVGNSLGASTVNTLAGAQSEFQNLEAKLRDHLTKMQSTEFNKSSLKRESGLMFKNPANIETAIKDIKLFLFGKTASTAYIGTNNGDVYSFLMKAGNYRTNKGLNRYLGMFEFGTKEGTLKSLLEGKASAMIIHLAEGRRDDSDNMLEYQYANEIGLMVKKMVLIHAVGLTEANMRDAKSKEISLVWSPFSNLLLYSQTLDVKKAKEIGLNIALGADWSPSGSKSLLDELKIARRYLKKAGLDSLFTDKQLVEMATVNAAKALGLTNVIGEIRNGFQADITLVNKEALKKKSSSNTDGYSALVYGEQADIDLVIVKGEPLFGNADLIDNASKYLPTKESELVPLNKSKCSFSKKFRYPDPNQSKLFNYTKMPALNTSVNTAAKISTLLTSKLKTSSLKLDALFNCEEDSSTEYGRRFQNFVERELVLR